MRLDQIRRDFKTLECLPVYDVNGASLVDEDLEHHEVSDYDGENHRVVLVDKVDTLEVPISESDERKTSW